jgi:hypothetical protein
MVKFISHKTLYIVLRSRFYIIIVPNVCAETEDKGDDTKDSFHGELECI